MINPFYEKLANLVVNYSINVKKGDRVVIEGPTLAEELFLALYFEIIKVGGHPLLFPEIKGTKELFYKYASEELIIADGKVIYEEVNWLIPPKI